MSFQITLHHPHTGQHAVEELPLATMCQYPSQSSTQAWCNKGQHAIIIAPMASLLHQLFCFCSSLLPEVSKQIPNRSRPSRNKTKKVIGGATDEEIAEHAARPRPTRPAAVRHLHRTRPKPKNGKMRAGKNINDAAEALLGMGSGFVDDDLMVGSRACCCGCLGFPAMLP